MPWFRRLRKQKQGDAAQAVVAEPQTEPEPGADTTSAAETVTKAGPPAEGEAGETGEAPKRRRRRGTRGGRARKRPGVAGDETATADTPANAKLFTDPTLMAVISLPANALPDESNAKSAASIGQLDAGYHSACRFRLSASVFPDTNTFNVADVIVAPSGNPDVSNRNNGTNTEYWLNANRRPAVNTAPPAVTDTDPVGGFPTTEPS